MNHTTKVASASSQNKYRNCAGFEIPGTVFALNQVKSSVGTGGDTIPLQNLVAIWEKIGSIGANTTSGSVSVGTPNDSKQYTRGNEFTEKWNSALSFGKVNFMHSSHCRTNQNIVGAVHGKSNTWRQDLLGDEPEGTEITR